MRKKKLEMLLSLLSDMKEPRADLEQYRTPSIIASNILFEAYGRGDIGGKKVCELGCGGAPFAIGSWILGASEVLGIDVDERAIQLAKENVELVRSKLEGIPRAPFELMVHDLGEQIPLSPKFDTVLMNPPFGAQYRHADRPFIERAMEISPVCYSIHNGNSYQFLKKISDAIEVEMEVLWEDDLEIPARFTFHREEKKEIGIVVVRFSR
jgi:putative methylase